MKIQLNILLVLVLLFGCKTENEKKDINEKVLTNLNSTTEKKSVEPIVSKNKYTNNGEKHSQVFNSVLQHLKKDGYTIITNPLNETSFISFDRNSNNHDTLTVNNVNQKLYKLKRKKPSEINGNTYPRFNLTELYFKNEENATINKLKIDSIINCTNRIDIRNEKKYDYCIQFSNRIIYIDCNSMYLSKYSNEYKEVIEKLIK